MSTMKGNLRRAILAGAILALAAAGVARADVTSDRAAAIVIFPKIVVDTSGLLGPPTDTELQLTNTSNSPVAARCFVVDATAHCSNAPTVACTDVTESTSATRRCPAGGVCVPQWRSNDFRMTLTKRQPISWKASEGLPVFPCDGVSTQGCFQGQSNRGSDGSPSFIPPVQEDPFVGEIKCVEVDPNDFLPTIGFSPANNAGGDLKGEVTIVAVGRTPGPANSVDARKYNAVGIESTTLNDRNNTLRIGPGTSGEYNGCPNVLQLNHFFDNAVVSTHRGQSQASVVTDLTVVPCSENFESDSNTLGGATLQFLVFNEFEQRFSTSTSFTCFREVQLSDIDTRPGPFGNAQSIFNVGVQGTISGQTRIRPVEGATSANGIIGIAEAFWTSSSGPDGVSTTAENLHFTGLNLNKGDVIQIPDEGTATTP